MVKDEKNKEQETFVLVSLFAAAEGCESCVLFRGPQSLGWIPAIEDLAISQQLRVAS